MKRLIILFVLLSTILSVYAGNVSLAVAKNVAAAFYTENTGKTGRFDELFGREFGMTSPAGDTLCFIFNLRDDDGFIIVSGDDRFPPVSGFSFEGKYERNHKNGAFDFWMNSFYNSVLKKETVLKNRLEWEKYLSGNVKYKTIAGAGPLLTIAWGQACYYNAQCPVDSAGSCYHARTGCGATAMAMILKYWDYPAHGQGSNSYYSPLYGTISADFENTFYDWQNMPPKLYSTSDSVQINAVAQLMYHCGVAVNMVYGAGASSSDEWNIRNAFTTHFDYSSYSQYIDKADFQDTIWRDIMKNEVDNGRPVFYGISSGSGGHFVVMDGYQDDDYFHFNWGYGNLNGYYKTFDELPVIQQAIINIEPNSDTLAGTTGFFAYNGIFNDGSNRSDYPSGKSYQWLISPGDANSVALMFTSFSTEYKADIVNIYDGETVSAPLLGSFSGHNLPPVVQTSGNKALVEFITNDSVNDSGWELRYTTDRSSFACSGITVLTDSAGTFDDGSGSANYIDNADCFWLIKPDTASSVTIHFDSFYTETDWDFLYVYDGENPSPENQLAVLTGNIAPADITSAKGAMLLHFHSDWNTNRPGWQVSYSSNYEKINLNLKVFLQGPFNGTGMDTTIHSVIPSEQPFDKNPSADYYYEGTETAATIPANAVDWILIELRDSQSANAATAETIFGQRAVFLLSDGMIVGSDGSAVLSFNQSLNDSLFVVIRHRNHTGIMSAKGLSASGGIFYYDFTTPAGKAYGTNAQKELIPGVFGMYAGDANGDGEIDTDDLLFWDDRAGNPGYDACDFNLDGQTDNSDKDDLLIINFLKGSFVPE